MKALELGALEVILLWEDLEVKRYEFKNTHTEKTTVHILNEKQELEKDQKYFNDPETGAELDVVNSENLTDWLLVHYKKYGI